MIRQAMIEEMADKLGENKEKFLSETKSAVASYIANQNSRCLSVVGLGRDGEIERTYDTALSFSFAKVLFAFCRGQQYEDRKLDSALTQPVANVVVEQFEKLYGEKSEDLSKALLKVLTEDTTILNSIVQTMIDSRVAGMVVGQARRYVTQHITKEISHKACALIVEYMKSHAAHTSVSVGGHIAKAGKEAIGYAATAALAKTVALIVLKMIAAGMGPLLVKLLASAAFKVFIVAAVKKMIIAAVGAAIVKFIVLKLGIASGTAWLIVVAPLIIAFISYEMYWFPTKLGEKVSEKLYSELDTSFSSINKTILEKLFDGLGGETAKRLAQNIAGNSEVIASLDELLESMAAEHAATA